jgi:hypothetical protein
MRPSTRTRRARRSFAAAFLMVAVACAGTPAAPPRPEGVETTLLLFSGMPNPRFQLDQTAIAHVAALLAAATPNPSFEHSSVIPSILGYQGIRLVNGAGASALPAEVSVRGTDVETLDGETTRFLTDPAGGLESFLLEQAIEHKAITREMLADVRGR